MDQRIKSIQNKITYLSSECTNKHVFARRLKSLLSNTNSRPISIDNIIIIYSYVYNHRYYLFELNWTNCIHNLIDHSDIFINQFKEHNDPHYKEIVTMAIDILHQTKLILISYLESRVHLF